MVKLSKRAWGPIIICTILICTIVTGSYLFVGTEISLRNNPNKLIFGRNIYEQENYIGKEANPNYQIVFPKDHASHEDFNIEWWYLTANLEDDSGKPFGLQWTLFRFVNPFFSDSSTEGWHNKHIYMAHASIHSLNKHWFMEKFARGGVGNAGISTLPFSLFIDNWQWINIDSTDSLFPATLEFNAYDYSDQQISPINASFKMTQDGPFVMHGQNGFSVKSNSTHASHYYSAPFVHIEGTIKNIDDSNLEVATNLIGQAWFDHEWSSTLLDDTVEGWDWLSLHLNDGSKIMAFRMRIKNQVDYITGSYISPAGVQSSLDSAEIFLQISSTTTLRDKTLPLKWSLSIPSKDIDIMVSTIKNDQYNDAMMPYYEGMVTVKGSHNGRGFLELTGY